MKKADLIDAVQEALGGSKSEATDAVAAVLDSIAAGVKKDENVQIPGFGTFLVSHRAARQGRNPQTGETIQIKASKSVRFKPAAAFKNSL